MLALLLDQQISPAVAEQVRAKRPEIPVVGLAEWHDGGFAGQPDSVILRAAALERCVLVTYDRRTIPPTIREWSAVGVSHAGVVFVDNHTIASSNFGGLVRALIALWDRERDGDWTDRVGFVAAAPG
jgi:hypothetical protein